MTVSGGYGTNVSNSADANGYYKISIKPINIGGPFALSFSVTSIYGTYNTIQSNITVTAAIVVPVDKVLAGTVIAGQTGTMTNKVGSGTVITPGPVDQAIPQGYYDGAMGSGKVSAVTVPSGKVLSGTTIAGTAGTMPAHTGGANTLSLNWWTGGGSTVYLLPPAGYFDGSTWTYYTDPNLVSGNIKSGVSVLGVTGSYSGGNSTSGSQTYTTPGTYSFTVPSGVYSILAVATGGGGGGGSDGYNNNGGGAGGGGGTAISALAVTPGQNLTITVGAGGAAGAARYNSGAPGGSSSVNSIVAGGGDGGIYDGAGGYGGSGNALGGPGQSGESLSYWTSAVGGGGMGGYGNGGYGVRGYGGYPGPGSNGRVSLSW